MRHAFALALFSAVACSRPARPPDFALRLAVPGDLAAFHPNANRTYTAAAVDHAYDPLLRVGPTGDPAPGTARRWERLARDRVRVQIDPDLRFSDGSPVRADDVIRSLEGFNARKQGEWLEIEPGPSRAPIEEALFFRPIFRDALPAPLGTGAFALVDSSPSHIVLERLRPEPRRIGRVEIRAAPTARDAFARVLRGDANAVVGLDERQTELLEGVPGLRVVRGEGPHAVAVVMNSQRLRREGRKALGASIAVSELTRAYGGGCRALDGPGSGGLPPAGTPLQVAVSTQDAGTVRMALALRRALGRLGSDVVVEPFKQTLARWMRRDFDLLLEVILVWPPATIGWYWRTGGSLNWSRYSNPRVDAALDGGDLAAARAELESDPPVIYVCRRERIAAVDSRIRNASLGRFGLLDTLPDWEVSP